MLRILMATMYREAYCKLVCSDMDNLLLELPCYVAVFKMQDLSNGGLNNDCLAHMPTDEHWKCVFVPVSNHR